MTSGLFGSTYGFDEEAVETIAGNLFQSLDNYAADLLGNDGTEGVENDPQLLDFNRSRITLELSKSNNNQSWQGLISGLTAQSEELLQVGESIELAIKDINIIKDFTLNQNASASNFDRVWEDSGTHRLVSDINGIYYAESRIDGSIHEILDGGIRQAYEWWEISDVGGGLHAVERVDDKNIVLFKNRHYWICDEGWNKISAGNYSSGDSERIFNASDYEQIIKDWTPSYQHSWQRLDLISGSWDKIISSKSQEFEKYYTISKDDAGAQIRASIDFEDPFGRLLKIITQPMSIDSLALDNASPAGQLNINGYPENNKILVLDASSITDEDGIDSAFTHSWQVYDIDSSSWLNLDTTDATDGDTSLTLTSALIGKELRGRASYTDGNGLVEVVSSSSFTVEPAPVSGPVQQVLFPSNSINYAPGSTVTLPLLYNTGTGDNNLSGLTLNIHYNSSLLTPSGSATGIATLLGADDSGMISSAVIAPDTGNTDGDPNTDQRIELTWFSFSTTFPGTALPATLAEVSFSTPSLSVDPITGSPLSTTLNLSSDSTAINYSFSGGSTTLTANPFNLDVDGDGRVSPFGDGLMIIRKLLGTAFAGDALTDKAISASATRSTQQIHDFIQTGIDSKTLDLDQDGRVTAFSDGLMLIRSMLGTAFQGDALIDKAISANSPYYNQTNAWQSVKANIDALDPSYS